MIWQLVDDLDQRFGAAEQMRADLALLDDVASGAPTTLRWYRWSRPALSLGRFQPDADVDLDACSRLDVEVVRRPTGGRALLHGGDLTYAVAMREPAGTSVMDLYRRLARGLIAGLRTCGIEASVADSSGPSEAACFAGLQGADLRVGDRKLCGSAQLRHRGLVLQHGSILLERLEFDESDLLTPGDPCTRTAARARLRAATVTTAELGAGADAARLARAVTAGFTSELDVRFMSRERQPALSTSGGDRG